MRPCPLPAADVEGSSTTATAVPRGWLALAPVALLALRTEIRARQRVELCAADIELAFKWQLKRAQDVAGPAAAGRESLAGVITDGGAGAHQGCANGAHGNDMMWDVAAQYQWLPKMIMLRVHSHGDTYQGIE